MPTHAPSNLIGDDAHEIPGDGLVSRNPARPDEIVWSGSPSVDHVGRAVEAAREAQGAWWSMGEAKRIEALRAYQAIVGERVGEIAALITRETGKALWDSKAEAGILAGKVDITLDAMAGMGFSRTRGYEVSVGETRKGVCHFRPHGVMAVVGPFNFPAHLPNGHIVPALLMGNAVVFKPSDKTPAVGQMLAEMLREAVVSVGGPAGVVNLVQGGAEVAKPLVAHGGVDGVLFTGSWPVGREILRANLDSPGRIVALELGGNNPALVMSDCDFKQAVVECARASFITTGQRCTCTRRIIVHEAIAEKFIAALVELAKRVTVGDPLAEGTSIGPLVAGSAREAVLKFQNSAQSAGGRSLLECAASDGGTGGFYISPGVMEIDLFTSTTDATKDAGCDEEVFGPLVRVSRCSSYEDGLAQANATRYGLASSIFTGDDALACRFLGEARAGCVNVNTGTAGASGKLPFGGLGLSGNHRPAGAFSADYCAYPVASMVETGGAAAGIPGMAVDDSLFA
ncbi:MAG: aldehyde dehydrogenase family protein [Phycisphaerales bacterium]